MEIKRFLADDVREGMLSVRSLLGPDAVILSNRRVGQKIEILATNQFDAESLDVSQAAKRKPAVEVSDFGQSSAASADRSDDASVPVQRPVHAGLSHGSRLGTDNSAQAASVAVPEVEQRTGLQGPKNSNQSEVRPETSGQIQPLGGQSLTSPRQKPAIPKLSQVTSLGSQSLNDLQEELGSLKKLLVGELSKLRAERGADQGLVAEARDQLMNLGVSATTLEAVLAGFDAEVYQAQAGEAEQWRYLLRLLEEALCETDCEVIDDGGIFAIIGATGVGKTTTVAKLAARYALQYGREGIALITTDAFKIGGQDQLMTFGKLLNIQVQVAVDTQQLDQALEASRDKKLILIDSAGMNERDVKINRHLSDLRINGIRPKNLLIVSATSQLGLAEQVVEQYSHTPVHAAVLTKVDEAINLGSGLSTLLRTGLPLGYTCHGQGMSDIKLAKISSLLGCAFAMMKLSQHAAGEENEDHQIHA